MKKLILLFCLFSLCSSAQSASFLDDQLEEAELNTKYNATKKLTQKLEISQTKALNIKDPKLIKLTDIKPVDKKLYNEKLLKDEQIYKSQVMPALNKKTNSVNIEPAAVDFYNVYRISERLIRANKLDYVNWRIAIRKSPDDFNAAASTINYIQINTALYDSLYTNEDALAFVIAHEMAHLVFGHAQRKAELVRVVKLLEATSEVSGTANIITTPLAIGKERMASNEYKRMEFMADAEAMILLIKAGYSPEKAFDALKFINTLPDANIKYFLSSHPTAKNRIKSIKENLSVAVPQWVEEGKVNIYESEVLECKKSSDRVSIVISKSKNQNKSFYTPETLIQKLTRIAYMNYVKGNMNDAAKYFKKLANKTDDPIAYLYLSYVNENLYQASNETKYLKRATESVNKAAELAPDNEYIKKQISDLDKSAL